MCLLPTPASMAFHRCAPVWMCVFVESERSKTPVIQSEHLNTCIQSHKTTKWKSYTSLNKVRINLMFLHLFIRSLAIANNSGKTSPTFKIMESNQRMCSVQLYCVRGFKLLMQTGFPVTLHNKKRNRSMG